MASFSWRHDGSFDRQVGGRAAPITRVRGGPAGCWCVRGWSGEYRLHDLPAGGMGRNGDCSACRPGGSRIAHGAGNGVAMVPIDVNLAIHGIPHELI